MKGWYLTMKNTKEKFLKKISELGTKAAQKEANQACPIFHYQEVLPEEILKLRTTYNDAK